MFDMDGLMIDSQPYWQDAQLEVFAPFGVTITRQDTIDRTGMRVDEIVRRCYKKSPWDSVSREDSCNRNVNRVIELVQTHKPAMPGLNHSIDVCRQEFVIADRRLTSFPNLYGTGVLDRQDIAGQCNSQLFRGMVGPVWVA